PGKVHAPVPPTINGPNRLICLVRSVPNVEPAPPSCCRLATAKPCSSISTRSQPKSPSERTPLSSLIRLARIAPNPYRFRTIAHSCRCRRAHPNSTARKTSGSSCVRIGCQTGFSNPSTISSTTAATLGTHSSTSPGRLCPSRDATGQQSVTQSEDWYKTSAASITLFGFLSELGPYCRTSLMQMVSLVQRWIQSSIRCADWSFGSGRGFSVSLVVGGGDSCPNRSKRLTISVVLPGRG